MNCKQVQNLLNAYVDRELGCKEGHAVRAHLHDCDACHEEYVEIVTVKQLLGGLVAEDPSQDFEARLMRAVFQEAPVEQKRTLMSWFAGRPLLAFSSVGLASMAATLVVIVLSRPAQTAGGNVARQYDVATPVMSSAPDGAQSIAFEIQRDQIYAVGADASSGVTVVSASHGPRR